MDAFRVSDCIGRTERYTAYLKYESPLRRKSPKPQYSEHSDLSTGLYEIERDDYR